MKPGSIVVVLPFEIKDELKQFVKWVPVQDQNTPYMIRDVSNKACTFEEGVIGYHPSNHGELILGIRWVRELLPPEDISEVIEEIISEPVVL